MVIDLVYNIALLLSLSAIYAIYPFKFSRKSLLHVLALGIAIGLVGMLIMSRPFVFTKGLIFDSRTILIGVAGMVFGVVPTVIAVIMMVAYRLLIGGGGVITGVTTILTAFAIGSSWHHFRYQKFIKKNNPLQIEPFLVGLIIHVVMLLALFLVQQEPIDEVFQVMVLPLLSVYPLAFYVLAMLLFNQVHRLNITKQLEISEYRFKTVFAQAPMGICVTNSQTGKSVDVNHKFLEIVGFSKDEYLKTDWMTITHPDDRAEDLRQMELLRAGEIDNFSLDKRYIRRDGSLVWVNMAVTTFISSFDTTQYHLSMVIDISERKAMEEAIVYANTHDSLTGLYNRTFFAAELKKLDANQAYPLAIIIGDVNGLKIINDAFGRNTGDELLVRLAKQIRTVCDGGGVFCARTGGDEITFLLPQTEGFAAWAFIEKVQNRVDPIKVENVELTISFGVAVKHDVTEDLDEIMKQAENMMNQSKLSESPSSRSRAVQAIISTLFEKNPREELHSQRVSKLAVRLGEAYGLEAKDLAGLRTVGLLHDIGKIAIDESILNKEGPLNDDEWEIIKHHPETGWRILGAAGEFGELATYVLEHHERIDGRGYPRGLRGEDISVQARIIGVVDAYDAMTAARPYRSIMEVREAALELKRGSGAQFDAQLAQLFVEQVLQLSWDKL
ncbi:MAG: HD domain-containing phosphohydrolase [Sphaerochaetaceae bacterium]